MIEKNSRSKKPVRPLPLHPSTLRRMHPAGRRSSGLVDHWGSYCCDNLTLPNISGNLVISLKHPAKIVVTSFPLFSGKTPLQRHPEIKKSGWQSPDGTKLCLLHSVSFAKTHLETLLTSYCNNNNKCPAYSWVIPLEKILVFFFGKISWSYLFFIVVWSPASDAF